MTPEGRVKAMVNRELTKIARQYHFMPVQNGMGAPGLDYYCCIAGRFVAIETKVPGKNLTPRQQMTASKIVASGGLVFVIRDANDVQTMLARLVLHEVFGTGGALFDTHATPTTENPNE